MRNQPKYKFFANASYAKDGLFDIIKNETSFKIEIFCFIFFLIVSFFLPVSFFERILMVSCMVQILIAEIINSSIERVVDLVTTDYHPMAKRAKDLGSAMVLVSVVWCIVVWSVIIIKNLF